LAGIFFPPQPPIPLYTTLSTTSPKKQIARSRDEQIGEQSYFKKIDVNSTEASFYYYHENQSLAYCTHRQRNLHIPYGDGKKEADDEGSENASHR
jgi:hypothetical protein